MVQGGTIIMEKDSYYLSIIMNFLDSIHLTFCVCVCVKSFQVVPRMICLQPKNTSYFIHKNLKITTHTHTVETV